MKIQLQSTQEQHLTLNLEPIKRMSPPEVLDRIWLLWDAYEENKASGLSHRNWGLKKEYNWWVDVYNFKRGKLILNSK